MAGHPRPEQGQHLGSHQFSLGALPACLQQTHGGAGLNPLGGSLEQPPLQVMQRRTRAVLVVLVQRRKLAHA
jgi:hypothetical protein